MVVGVIVCRVTSCVACDQERKGRHSNFVTSLMSGLGC